MVCYVRKYIGPELGKHVLWQMHALHLIVLISHCSCLNHTAVSYTGTVMGLSSEPDERSDLG